MSERIGLTAGRWAVELWPARGAAVTRLTLDGRDILRPMPDNAPDLFSAASFPLVPYANRIAFGRLDAGGTVHQLPRNHPAQAHPLHGLGWLAAWQVADSGADRLVLVHDHDGDEHWPFPYTARQTVAVDGDGITFTLTLTNRADRPMPFSLGFHPYFAGGDDLRLSFASEAVWLADDQPLPTDATAADHFGNFAQGLPVRRPDLVDNSFTGWSGTALIEGPTGSIALSGENTPVLHVYMPPDADFFCAEPVTGLPDGVNRAPDLLDPQAETRITMRIASPA